METRIIKVNKENIDKYLIDEAGNILKDGGLVAFPTETVYGLGGNALDKTASEKIYRAKGRPSDNPLIVHIADIKDLNIIAENIPDKAYTLAESFWPGPLTMIFSKKDIVPYETTGGLDTVAVRMPNHNVALELIKASGGFIAAPSANTSGRPSPTIAKHVFDDLNGKIDAIIDGGCVGIGIESTIIDLTSDVPMILRPGYITKKMLEEKIGLVEVDKAIIGENISKNIRPKAPGMKYRHYAPKAELTIIQGSTNSVVDKINELVTIKYNTKKKVGVIATVETRDKYKCNIVKTVGSRSDDVSISQGLYRVLREFDDLDVDCIYTEDFSDEDFGQAIMNRLLKAAGHKVIRVD